MSDQPQMEAAQLAEAVKDPEASKKLLAEAGHPDGIEVELGGGTAPVRGEAEIEPALASLDVRRLRLAAFHPTGSLAAGSDQARHPVDPHGRLRGAKGVQLAELGLRTFATGPAPLAEAGLKVLIGRPRPFDTSFGFPSGHAPAAATFGAGSPVSIRLSRFAKVLLP